MITLEDQIRRYATDVAGPALAEPPADLGTVGQPRHRGRWVLVAALVVFIAGLTWVATRPSELGDRPSVDTIAPPPTNALATVSAPMGEGPCDAEGTVPGLLLDGPDGSGLCVAGTPLDETKALLRIFADGQELVRVRLSSCLDPNAVGSPPFSFALPDGRTITVGFLRIDAVYARSSSDPEARVLAAFDLDAFPDTRIVVARAVDPMVAAGLGPLDAAGLEQENSALTSAPTCMANDGSPTVTTFPGS